jgi:cytochrome c biogenesis protein CcdA
MEFVCTGQVYLPMIIAINRLGFGARAFSLLLLYNVAFIVPLVAVTILAYYGVGANALAKWAREHVFATKVAMAVLFLAMGILMAAMIFWS